MLKDRQQEAADYMFEHHYSDFDIDRAYETVHYDDIEGVDDYCYNRFIEECYSNEEFMKHIEEEYLEEQIKGMD